MCFPGTWVDDLFCAVKYGRFLCNGTDSCHFVKQSAYERIKIYRAVLIVPWALPSTIAILAWQGLLNEQYGGINNLLHTIGIAWNVPWLTNPFWARVGLIIVNVWLGFPI